MAKKTLLSESQIASFMKLANIRTEKVENFKKKTLKEEMTGMGGTGGMEEDEPEAEMTDDEEMEPSMDLEPEQPVGGTIEKESDELMNMIKDAVKAALADAGLGSEEAPEAEMELSDEMGMDTEEEGEEEEYEEEMEDEEEEEEQEMEEYELQEAKKKAAKKARNLEGGDAKKIKESLAFSNVELVTDEKVINEVLKRVIRRIL